MSSTPAFNCRKWADCACRKCSVCACGENCPNGSVLVSDVNRAMQEQCNFSDCSCGLACTCGSNKCVCGGTSIKNTADWIDTVKAITGNASCQCPKADDGTCTAKEGTCCRTKCC